MSTIFTFIATSLIHAWIIVAWVAAIWAIWAIARVPIERELIGFAWFATEAFLAYTGEWIRTCQVACAIVFAWIWFTKILYEIVFQDFKIKSNPWKKNWKRNLLSSQNCPLYPFWHWHLKPIKLFSLTMKLSKHMALFWQRLLVHFKWVCSQILHVLWQAFVTWMPLIRRVDSGTQTSSDSLLQSVGYKSLHSNLS